MLGDEANFAAAVIAEAPGDFPAAFVQAGYGGSPLEVAVNFPYPYRQQTLPLAQGLDGSLVEQAVAVPLFTQQKRLLVANGIEGLVFDPFGPVLDVTYATKS